jgi:hypothetical protein
MHTLHEQHTLVPQDSIYSKNKMFLASNFRIDLFYAEMQNKIKNQTFDPLWSNMFGGTLETQRDLRLKKLTGTKIA